MTVCIAARCIENNSFVLTGDRQFSYGTHAIDSMSLKRVLLTPDERWKLMFAASPVSHVMPIVRRARHLLEHANYRIPYDLDAIRNVCVRAYREERERLVNERILSRYGTDLDSWKVQALNFGAAEVARINQLIEAIEVGVELIVFGYDSRPL